MTEVTAKRGTLDEIKTAPNRSIGSTSKELRAMSG